VAVAPAPAVVPPPGRRAVWVDEKPPRSRQLRPAEDALRSLLHHRTGLILAEDRLFGALWELGLTLFPNGSGSTRAAARRREGSRYSTGPAASRRPVYAPVGGGVRARGRGWREFV